MKLSSPVAGLFKTPDLQDLFGPQVHQLPWVHRILLENIARKHKAGLPKAIDAFRSWLSNGKSDEEILFHPARVLMHDTTCVPALVDIAAMRDAIREAGGDPTTLAPVIPVDVSVDHSVGVDRYGSPDALEFNMRREMERNIERYRLMKWATTVLPGVTVHPPGTGIMHTINLEQLATVIKLEVQNGETWAVPDTLIGTDSHTPMINGIGVLAWGVGGLEAESVLFGFPVTLRLPDVVGVRLSGRLPSGVLSTDLALHVTHLLRKEKVSGEFVEFFGEGMPTLTGGDRAVVANMAPEYGASTGYFPIDEETIKYLRNTGRSAEHCALVEEAARRIKIWFDPTIEPRYTRVIELDLASVKPLLAGPRRPQDKLTIDEAFSMLEREVGRSLDGESNGIPDGAIAIAAITSCTNTSDQRLLAAAGLVARNANRLGLRPPYWVKTSLAPGSPSAERFLKRSGLLADLEAIGFGIVGQGCTTCIGNSGPLQPDMGKAVENGTIAAALISGNRNFPGRVHPSLQFGFLASPPAVVALSLLGKFDSEGMNREISRTHTGKRLTLRDLMPSDSEIDAVVSFSDRDDFGSAFAQASQNTDWGSLDAPASPTFSWDPASTYIRRPPFAAANIGNRLGRYTAHPLLVLGDDMTTDHISPAGQIGRTSYAGQYLIDAGDPADDLNVYAARRGNWRAMVRGLFDNRNAANLLLDGRPALRTLHAPSGEEGPLWDIAERYKQEGRSVVIVAGERYGAGSSRDWAAKGVALLGARAVIAKSFERIHRTNLIGMGVLPISIVTSRPLRFEADDTLNIDTTHIEPRGSVSISIIKSSGETISIPARAAVDTEQEIETLWAGGMIPQILKHFLTAAG